MRFFQSPIVAATMGAALVAAAPTTEIDARGSCTFNTVDQLKSGKSSCSTITLSNIHVPAGETLDLTDLKTGATVIFDGTTTFGYKEWKGPLISASGQGITIKQNKGARLDGGGQRWWDSKGSNGGKTKPKFFAAHKLQQSSINGLQIYNTPVQGFSILSDHLNVNGVTINNSEGKGKGHNTDAFDVSQSSWITIDGATVYNQDDCLAINSGEHITFTNGYCNGGHGISIGSVGGRNDNAVSDVTLSNSHVVDSATGTRIKTIYNAQGSVTGVKYQNIILENISEYGIIVEQDYENGKPTGRPTNGVKIEDITFEKVVGTVDKKGTNIYILCGEGSCSNWTWTGNNITGGRKSTKCENVPNGASC